MVVRIRIWGKRENGTKDSFLLNGFCWVGFSQSLKKGEIEVLGNTFKLWLGGNGSRLI